MSDSSGMAQGDMALITKRMSNNCDGCEMMYRFLLLACLVATQGFTVRSMARSQGQSGSPAADRTNSQSTSLGFEWRLVPSELASPLTTRARYTFGTGVILTTLLSANYRKNVVIPTQENFQQQKPLGKSSKLGEFLGFGVPNLLYAVGFYTAGRWWENPEGLRRTRLMAKTTIYAAGVTTVLKHLIKARRPDHSDYLSFPSGHTTTAFAFASVVGFEHSLYWGVAAYSLATFIGLSRINDNQHYLNDVVAGATFGASFGLGLSYLQGRGRADDTALFYLVPNANGGELRYSFTY